MRDTIKVQATLSLLSTNEGGRTTPIFSGYRPNHVFEYVNGKVNNTFIGEMRFEEEALFPGGQLIATVVFLDTPTIQPFLSVGRNWRIHEGPILVGTGEIISIIEN